MLIAGLTQFCFFFFFNDTATTEIYTLSLHDALPIWLLGEDLVAFRTRSGQVGLVGEFCSHRLASLYYGRVEGEAIRCLYHGWLYGTTGTCLEQGNLPAEHQFTQRIQHPGYRCVEHGGVIWAYIGPSAEPPP